MEALNQFAFQFCLYHGERKSLFQKTAVIFHISTRLHPFGPSWDSLRRKQNTLLQPEGLQEGAGARMKINKKEKKRFTKCNHFLSLSLFLFEAWVSSFSLNYSPYEKL